MKVFQVLFFALLLAAFGCGNAANQESDTEVTETVTTETEEATEKEEEPTTIIGDGYTITVVEAGIASPRKEMKGQVGDATVTINYGSPSVKGRKIWGGLEEYGEMWRTGANKATSFEADKDIMVNGEKLPAGKYGFFTIPGEDAWVVIFNKNYDQWGNGSYAEEEDVLRLTVKPQVLEEVKEEMDFIMDGDMLALQWEKVSVPLQVSL